jgi:hypothetical protein
VGASYGLPKHRQIWLAVSNNLALAVGKERANLIARAPEMGFEIGVSRDIGWDPIQTRMVIQRELVGGEQRLKAEVETPGGTRGGYLPQFAFPAAFRPLFPNGWADVAQREGFELPKETEQK